MSLRVTPLTGSIGASVHGIDIKRPIDSATFDELKRAFLKHQVLVFRDQNLFEPKDHLRFSELWGKPVPASALSPHLPGFPEITHVTKIPKETASTEAWHYDSPYTPKPPKISILSALTVPNGGDTMWCNQYNAYDRLSPTMQKTIAGLRVKFVALRLGRMMGFAASDLPTAVHPLVRTHPETGRKALYVGHRETAQQIEGMTVEESRPLLDFLYEQSTSPDNFYRHMWEAGDVVMWDNRCTMHYAVHDYGEQERVLNRITMEGEVPR